ncbi:MAG: hypothetical protein HY747_00010 [Elusimicrobia bacterium]|nr:hypothetical protein [Elusimicrobiota bacterium]
MKEKQLPPKIGIIGARGLVGEELLALLEKTKWAQDIALISTEPKSSGRPTLSARRHAHDSPRPVGDTRACRKDTLRPAGQEIISRNFSAKAA